MPFSYNSTGINPDMNYRILPDKKWFPFKIIETSEETSRAGYEMVKCICESTDDVEWSGIKVWHYVTFIPKGEPGAGIAVHFLKSIGQPWEGEITVNPNAWRGTKFMGFVVVDEYNGKKNNKIKQVNSINGLKPAEEVPF